MLYVKNKYTSQLKDLDNRLRLKLLKILEKVKSPCASSSGLTNDSSFLFDDAPFSTSSPPLPPSSSQLIGLNLGPSEDNDGCCGCC